MKNEKNMCEYTKCLSEIGCSIEQVNKYKVACQSDSIEHQIKVLKCIRCEMLEELHVKQKNLQCIDYMIYKKGHLNK